MSSSYKPALLKALTRLVRRSGAAEIPLIEIGAEFVTLYWVQTVVFRLRQASAVSFEPEAVQRIRRTAESQGVRDLSNLDDITRARLDKEMAKLLTTNVLDAFHRSKPPAMALLFEWRGGDNQSIRIPPAALSFLRDNTHALESIANLWWARYLEKCNMLAPLIIQKVERNGAKRASLTPYLRLLQQYDEPRCFYCERLFGDSVTTHVDHVIPWSFLLSDPLWDLVLSCSSCNLQKSDRLPEKLYIDKLAQTGLVRARFALPKGFASPLIPRDELDRYYDAALSVEWPSGWSPMSS